MLKFQKTFELYKYEGKFKVIMLHWEVCRTVATCDAVIRGAEQYYVFHTKSLI